MSATVDIANNTSGSKDCITGSAYVGISAGTSAQVGGADGSLVFSLTTADRTP